MTPTRRASAPGDLVLACTLSPSGQLHLEPDPTGEGPALAPTVARRITRAFEAGRGAALLHLGAAEVGTALPPSLAYWRDFAQAFVALWECRLGSDEAASEAAAVRGPMVSDAYLAALAIEHGCELVTTDADFSRFPDLRWRHPLGAP